MTVIDFEGVRWRKSARSTGASTCVEASVLPADSRWRMSARTDGANACVEAAADGLVVAVRNTTDRTGPTLVVPSAGWHAFLDVVRTGRVDYPVLGVPAPFGPFEISRVADGLVQVALCDDPEGPTIRYTRLEWDVFTAGVTIDGEFTVDWLLDAPAPA